jgi:RNA recognition motif-containing protein
MAKKLFVGNLAYSATEADLREAFAPAGEIASVRVVLDRDTGRPRGFAFIEMNTDAEATQAISMLNGRDLQGRPLTVREAEERAPRREGAGYGGGGGGGYSGGAGAGGGGGGYGGGGDRDRSSRGGGRNRW